MKKKRLLVLALLFIVAVGLTALWRWTPMADRFSLEVMVSWAARLRQSPTTPFWIVAAFVVAGQVFFPITLLSLATVFAFGPILGSLYSIVGSLLAGIVTYFVGRLLGEATVCKFGGPKLEKLRRQVKEHGLATSITVHILPVAPFTLVNLVSGACGVRLRDFILGTLIGHLPGTVSILLFQNQLARAIRSPDPLNIAMLAVVIAAITAATLWLQQRIGKKAEARRLSMRPVIDKIE
jgi:uncharacterized membrane protein YdjX (TVP38/TMEM64 family)